jgi:DNA polymerase-3 subunit epsilon
MSQHPDQLGFEWLDRSLDDVPAVVPKRATKRGAPQPAAPALTYEQMAQLLDASADFKVLRRLEPVYQFPPAPVGAELRRVAILDTETTGLSHELDRVIELAVVVVDVDIATGQPVAAVQVFDGLEDPGRPISAEITQLTGIRNEDVRGKKIDEDALAAVMSGVHWVVAHNAGFDRPFVEARLPKLFADLPWACSFADLDWKSFGQGSAKLEALAADVGLFYAAHRADIDCHALLAVLTRKCDPKTGETLLKALWHAGQATHYKLSAVGAPFETKDTLKARGYRWDSQARVWSTKLTSLDSLNQERAWLSQMVYANPKAPIRIETLRGVDRYAKREGDVVMEPLLG